jgi:hypothetical protein
MLAHRNRTHRFMLRILRLSILLTFLAACQATPTVLPISSPDTPRPASSVPDYPKAEVILQAHSPAELAKDQNLYLEILDEVSGLALNAARVQMTSTNQQDFVIRLPVVAGSVLKYRYVRDNDPIGIEYTSQGQQVRYRLLVVNGPMTIQDTIAGWKFQPPAEKLGRIQGQVAFKTSNAPVVNALITAGGMHTLTASNGSFMLEGLPEGLHNMVIYSLDGTFRAFQQGAVVAHDSTTPASVQVEANKMVNVTFIVDQPDASLKGAPIRIIGNIYPLGNTFADLRGGLSTVASRAPNLAFLPDGRYSITMKLPAGFDLRYKYTLGDGFWNTERYKSGAIRLRQLLVPDSDVTVEDAVETWQTPGLSPISFTVTVPSDTPITDTISIQLNPFSWTEPIPMWPLGNNRWFYLLYNPLNEFSKASYRYCRNDQCGVADSSDSLGPNAAGIQFSPQETPLEFQDVVSSWGWSEAASEPVVVSSIAITAREAGFVTGVEFMPGYHPSWQPHLSAAFQNLQDIGANTVILTPTWHLTHQAPPVIEPIPGKDALWTDLTQMTLLAKQKGLYVILHPVIQFQGDPAIWWQTAARDDGWWQSWFDRYETYLIHHADLATQTGAKALIIGDENLIPALPGGTLFDGSPSGVPGNCRAAVEKTVYYRPLALFRHAYLDGAVFGKMPPIPAVAAEFDQIYIQLSPPFAETDQIDQKQIEENLAALIDGDVLALHEQANQPVIIGLRYPSVQGMMDGCVDSVQQCLRINAFYRPVNSDPGVEISLHEQADVYSAALSVINQRSWISGFSAVGYYPPVEVKDSSISVRSKPASDVLWYWYPRLLGKAAP